MSDAEKKNLNKQMDEGKPDVDQEKDNEPSPSAPAEKAVPTDAHDDNTQKFLKAYFELNKAKICQNMWNIYNA